MMAIRRKGCRVLTQQSIDGGSIRLHRRIDNSSGVQLVKVGCFRAKITHPT